MVVKSVTPYTLRARSPFAIGIANAVHRYSLLANLVYKRDRVARSCRPDTRLADKNAIHEDAVPTRTQPKPCGAQVTMDVRGLITLQVEVYLLTRQQLSEPCRGPDLSQRADA